ncbi:MAG: S8 family serine peptidase [Proteobacteria bacterium]|nr:S8 family serine peptidase [Pseudomonadota bacterium]
MAKFILAIIALAVIILSTRIQPETTGLRASAGYNPPSSEVQILAVLSPGAPGETAHIAERLAQKYELRVLDRWRLDSLARDCVVFEAKSSIDVEAKLSRFKVESVIESVQTVQLFSVAGKADELKSDPYADLQHSLINARIDEAHALSTGMDVKVAIIDTGLDRSNVDLRNRISATLNFVDADQTIEIVEFHATAVAGIIGAAANNGRGIVGIAPNSTLYSLRACWESNPGTSRGQCSSFALARALDWAISNDMKVVNMSLQGEYDLLVSRLIARAVEEGVVVVAATDIDAGQFSFPASMNEVIAVTSSDRKRAVDFTRSAGKVFIAPGEEILTTMPDNTFDFVSGSSFASAHIAGIVALLAEHVPTIDAHTVRAVLRSSTRIANWTISIDACEALATVTGAEDCRSLP